MKLTCRVAGLILAASLASCALPSEHLSFPPRAVVKSDHRWQYDVSGDGRADFSLRIGGGGRCDVIAYDDDEDGKDDRVYRLSDYDPARVPHVILMLDSIPYRTVSERYQRGDWPWFPPPVKVIPPFPSMSAVVFSTTLHAPPQPGMINRYYDRRTGAVNNRIVKRSLGAQEPWLRMVHYHARYWENGLAFLRPLRWFAAEMARAKRAVDESPDRVTILYIASSSGMLSRYGEQGAQEVLDALERFCVGLLFERQGAIKISILADHGHNYLPGRRVDLDRPLVAAGYRVTDRIREDRDIVSDRDGLVNYAGFHTRKAGAVSDILARQPHVQFVAFMRGEEVIFRTPQGDASIAKREGRYRYRPETGDPLGYAPVVAKLTAEGRATEDGFVSSGDWFRATKDLHFPDAPHRLWQAFHGEVVNPPDVMLALDDGYCAGIGAFETFIRMKSTHGGLDQINSATFLLDMAGRAREDLRSEDVLRTIAPGYSPAVR